MKERFALFFVATALSEFGMRICLREGVDFMTKVLLSKNFESSEFFTFVLLVIPWIFYFIISYKWVMGHEIKKNIKLYGTIMGCSAILVSMGFALAFVGSSVFFMIYVLFFDNSTILTNNLSKKIRQDSHEIDQGKILKIKRADLLV